MIAPFPPRSHLGTLTLSVVAVFFASVVACAAWVLTHSAREQAIEATLGKARAIIQESFATLEYFEKLGARDGVLRREEMKARLAEDLALATSEEDRIRRVHRSGYYQTVPVVAAWSVAREHADELGYQFRTPRKGARNPENEPNAIEEQLLAELAAGQEEAWHVDEATEKLHFATAVRLTASCLDCHGGPEHDPEGDGLDLLGVPMENKRAGDLHGAFEVIGDLSPALARAREASASIVAFGLSAMVLALAIVAFAMRPVATRLPNDRSVLAALAEIEPGPEDESVAPPAIAIAPDPRSPLPDPAREPVAGAWTDADGGQRGLRSRSGGRGEERPLS